MQQKRFMIFRINVFQRLKKIRFRSMQGRILTMKNFKNENTFSVFLKKF